MPLQKTSIESRTCSKCNKDYEPRGFAYGPLAELEDDGQVFLAVCLYCDPIINMTHPSQAPRKCIVCHEVKERNEFSFQRQRCKNYSTWKCKTCDFPACDICGALPTVPKKSPYRCESCLFPPCSCGRPRPQSTKYKNTNEGMKTWTCSKCKTS